MQLIVFFIDIYNGNFYPHKLSVPIGFVLYLKSKTLESLHGLSMFAVRAKIIECYIIKPAQSLLMKHLVIGLR